MIYFKFILFGTIKLYVLLAFHSDLMAKRKEENFLSPENAKRPRLQELEDFDRDGDEDECTVSFTNGTSTLVSAKQYIKFSIGKFFIFSL